VATRRSKWERTALYRLYDAEDDLLYIGISRDPEKRFKAHAHDKNWWHCVRYVDLTWFSNYPAARQAENAAHRSERPPYNGMGHTGLGWDIPALRYDDSADQADIRQRLLAALEAGTYVPGSHLWPFHLSRTYGYSRSTTDNAMSRLAREGHLERRRSTYVIPDRQLLPAASTVGQWLAAQA
jgi:predicted GIY-YIG superfamily endonuclease